MTELYFDGGPAEEEWPGLLEPYTDEFGAFVSYGEAKFVLGEAAEVGKLVTVYQQTVYDATTMVWQVSFTTEYEVVGLRL